MTGLDVMATPLHHDQPQRALQNLGIKREDSRSSCVKKNSTSLVRHDENLATLPDPSHRGGAQQLPPRPVHHLRQRRPESSSPHGPFDESLRPILSSSHSDLPHGKSSLEECRPSHLGHSSRYPVGNGCNSQEEGHQTHPPEQHSFGTVNPINNRIENPKEDKRFQALQSLVAPNSYPLNYKAAVLRDVPVGHALNHHEHVNHENYFGCTEDDKKQRQSKSNTLFEQQQCVIVNFSETQHVNESNNFHAVEQTESCHKVASLSELSTQENQAEITAKVDHMASEQTSQAESHFQQLQRELSESSSDDSFCHISKEAVEQEYQNDGHLAPSIKHQVQSQPQPCSVLVYDYSRAGVTLDEDSSDEQQRDRTENGVLNDEKDIDNDVCKIDQRDQQQDVESPPLFLGFNHSSTRFACGTSKGFRVYDINTMRECFNCMIGGVGLVELVLNTDLFLLVGGGPNPCFPLNNVIMWDAAKGKSIAQWSHKFPILAVKARQDRLVAVSENEVCVYNLSNARLLFHVHTISNIKGLCAISMKDGPSVLACPGLKKGEVRIEHIGANRKTGDLPTRNSFDISAHDSGLACVVLNAAGSLLATASDRGTLVRIFNTEEGAPLQEFRRGLDRAEIYSIAFSFSSDWLAVSSDKGTVHIFGVRTIGSDNTDTHGVSSSIRNPGSTLSFIKGVLPRYFRSEWSYAQFKLPEEMKSVVAFGQERHSIFVLGTDGSFSRFSFDCEHGGDMKQLECLNFLKASQ